MAGIWGDAPPRQTWQRCLLVALKSDSGKTEEAAEVDLTWVLQMAEKPCVISFITNAHSERVWTC